MTTRVCSDVPEAIFVSAHAASNYSTQERSKSENDHEPFVDNAGEQKYHDKSDVNAKSSVHSQRKQPKCGKKIGQLGEISLASLNISCRAERRYWGNGHARMPRPK